MKYVGRWARDTGAVTGLVLLLAKDPVQMPRIKEGLYKGAHAYCIVSHEESNEWHEERIDCRYYNVPVTRLSSNGKLQALVYDSIHGSRITLAIVPDALYDPLARPKGIRLIKESDPVAIREEEIQRRIVDEVVIPWNYAGKLDKKPQDLPEDDASFRL